MALEKLRDTWEGILNPVLESLSGVKPSTVTWVALPLGILGGLAVLTAEDSTHGANMLFGGGLLIIMAMPASSSNIGLRNRREFDTCMLYCTLQLVLFYVMNVTLCYVIL